MRALRSALREASTSHHILDSISIEYFMEYYALAPALKK